VSTSDGQQLRRQQGTRAIGVGDQVVAHDNTAVFTGEAGVLPKPGRVFISAPRKAAKFSDQYFAYYYFEMFFNELGLGWWQYPPPALFSQSFTWRTLFRYSTETALGNKPIRNLRLIISDGHGNTARLRAWEEQRMSMEPLFGGADETWESISRPIFFHYNGLIGVHWFFRVDTRLLDPAVGVTGQRTQIRYYAALFTPDLKKEIRTELIGTRSFTNIFGQPLPGVDPLILNHPYYQLKNYLVPGTAAIYGPPWSSNNDRNANIPSGSTSRPESLTTVGWFGSSIVQRSDYTNYAQSVRSEMYFDVVIDPTILQNRIVAAPPPVDDSVLEYQRLIDATELDLDPNPVIPNRPFFETMSSFIMTDKNKENIV